MKGKVSHQQSKNPPPGGAGPSSGVDGGGGRSIAEITTNVREMGLSFKSRWICMYKYIPPSLPQVIYLHLPFKREFQIFSLDSNYRMIFGQECTICTYWQLLLTTFFPPSNIVLLSLIMSKAWKLLYQPLRINYSNYLDFTQTYMLHTTLTKTNMIKVHDWILLLHWLSLWAWFKIPQHMVTGQKTKL